MLSLEDNVRNILLLLRVLESLDVSFKIVFAVKYFSRWADLQILWIQNLSSLRLRVYRFLKSFVRIKVDINVMSKFPSSPKTKSNYIIRHTDTAYYSWGWEEVFDHFVLELYRYICYLCLDEGGRAALRDMFCYPGPAWGQLSPHLTAPDLSFHCLRPQLAFSSSRGDRDQVNLILMMNFPNK